MSNEVEIFFSDLNEKGQQKVLEAMGIEDPKDGNLDIDVIPLAILEYEEETDDN